MRIELTLVLASWVIAMTGCMTLSADKQLADSTTDEVTAQSAAILDKALSHEAAGDLAAARAAYSELLVLVPQHPQACHHLAILLDREGRFSESDVLYQRAVDSHENRAEVLADYAYSQYIRGDVDKAEATLRDALRVDRNLKRAHNNLGLVLANQGREQEALEQFSLGGCSRAEAISNYENVRRWQVDPALALTQPSDEPDRTSTVTDPMIATKDAETTDRSPAVQPVPVVATDENQNGGSIHRVRDQPTVTLFSETTSKRLTD